MLQTKRDYSFKASTTITHEALLERSMWKRSCELFFVLKWHLLKQRKVYQSKRRLLMQHTTTADACCLVMKFTLPFEALHNAKKRSCWVLHVMSFLHRISRHFRRAPGKWAQMVLKFIFHGPHEWKSLSMHATTALPTIQWSRIEYFIAHSPK